MDLQNKEILVYLDNNVYKDILLEAENEKNVETGGMLFGFINSNDEGKLELAICKTHIPHRRYTRKTPTYFEINEEYARNFLYNEKMIYLGNWHKHLGYGGPSAADHKQISVFFRSNPHKNMTIAVVIDFLSRKKSRLFVEIYIRENDRKHEENTCYRIIKPANKNVQIINKLESMYSIEANIESIFDNLKRKIIIAFDNHLLETDIKEYASRNTEERIIGFPIILPIKENFRNKDSSKHVLKTKLLISIPIEFPNGEIYVDLSSEDLTKMITLFVYQCNPRKSTDLLLTELISKIDEYVIKFIPRLLNLPLKEVFELSDLSGENLYGDNNISKF